MNFNSVFFLKRPQILPGHWLRQFFHQLVPCFRLCAIVETNHGNALLYRAHDVAEPASDAIAFADFRLFPDFRRAVRSYDLVNKINALMSSVFTCNITEIALNTLRFVNPCNSFEQ